MSNKISGKILNIIGFRCPRRLSLSVIGLCLAILAPEAQASGNGGFSFNLGLYYTKGETHRKDSVSGTVDTADNTTIYDLNLGYIFENKFYLGVLSSTSSSSSSNSSSSSSHQGIGTGYHFNEMAFIHAFYVQNATYANTYTGGTGYQFDLGFAIPFSGKAHVGTELSYRSITYKQYASGATGTLISYNIVDIFPMFILGFDF